jgi:DNA-binding CsgD family transcriptional regulator
MKFLLQQEKRFYLFAFYVALVLIWVAQQIFTLRFYSQCFTEGLKLFEYAELGLAVLPLFGIYLLHKDLKKNKEEVNSALEAIHKLKHQNLKLTEIQTDFWNTTKQQFQSWNFTETEKQISLLILRGYSNQQIAAVRGKSLKTIENQTFSIYQKSSTTGKIEFIAFFLSPLLPEEE